MRVVFQMIFIIFILIKNSILLSSLLVYYKIQYEKNLSKLGKNLCKALHTLGPAFVKLGQFLSTRNDLINSTICNELRTLQDNAPSVEFSKIERILICELKNKYSNIIIDSQPVATASIAQVHKGEINGELVAIKVLKPGIRKMFLKNIDFMMFVATLINKFIQPAKRLRLKEVVNIIQNTANIELDMQMEAAVASKLKENENTSVYIPKIFWEYTTKNVLVSEWIDGTRIENIDESHRQDVAERLAFTFFSQAFVNGFFHADIHPGNILFDIHNRIVLLDFGVCSYLPEKDRILLAQIIYYFAIKNYEKVAELHLKAGYVKYKKNNYDEIKNNFALACRTIAEPVFGKSSAEISMSTFLRRLFEVTSEFNMHTQPQLILLQKNIVSLEGVLKTLNINVNMWTLIQPWFTNWIEQNLSVKFTIKRQYNRILNILEKLESLIERS